MERNKHVTILAERENEVLIKIEGSVLIGERTFKTVRHEWWFDKEKMKLDVYGEDGYIYCRGFSGSSDEDVILAFNYGH